LRASPLGEIFCPGRLANQNAGAGNNCTKAHYIRLGKNSAESPFSVAVL
jgi:hypothetical protein